MDAEPVLRIVARVLAERRLETVLIGNAAAALQGSPVTTVDLDFMFGKTPTNIRKLKAVADDLDAVVMRPFYPASELFRVVRDRDSLQLDFMSKVDGVRSSAFVRARRLFRSAPTSSSLRLCATSFAASGAPVDRRISRCSGARGRT